MATTQQKRIKAIQDLKNVAETLQKNRVDYKSVKVKGVNCSPSDVDFIVDFCNHLLNGRTLSNFITSSEIKQVFSKIGIDENTSIYSE